MEFKSSKRYLKQLNKNVILVTFHDAWWFWDATDSVEAEFFGSTIKVWFPNCKQCKTEDMDSRDKFSVEIIDQAVEQTDNEYLSNEKGETEFETIEEIIELINAYLRSRQ